VDTKSTVTNNELIIFMAVRSGALPTTIFTAVVRIHLSNYFLQQRGTATTTP